MPMPAVKVAACIAFLSLAAYRKAETAARIGLLANDIAMAQSAHPTHYDADIAGPIHQTGVAW